MATVQKDKKDTKENKDAKDPKDQAEPKPTEDQKDPAAQNEENTGGDKEENLQESQTDEKPEKYINPELLNDDQEESLKMEKLAVEVKPYFASNTLPKSLYLQKSVLPIVYEAMSQVEKIRPKDPIEFLAVYLLDKSKKE